MAASTIGTNVVTDEQELLHFYETIVNVLEKKYLLDDENKKKIKLMNKLKNHISLGGQIAYNIIPAQYSNKVIEMLEDQSIPYMAAPDGSGNFMVIVKDTDKDKLLEIQKDIEMLSTDYVKELTAQNMLSLYKAHGIKDVDSLNFNNKEMAEIAKQKLFQSGITFAEIEKKDGSIELIVSPMSKFSKTGEDLACFELHHAFEQSKADDMFKSNKSDVGSDFLNTRFKQGEYDRSQLDSFAQNIKQGKNGVLCSLKGNQKFCIEKNEIGVFILEKEIKDGAPYWKSTQLDIQNNASVKDISTLLSKYTERITDMGIVNKATFESIRDEKLEPNDPRVASSKKRPGDDCISKDVSKYTYIVKKEIDPMIDAINREATRQVNAAIGEKVVSQEKSYQMKKEAIENIMHARQLPEIQNFLNSATRGMDLDEKQEWYNNIVEHFENTHENTEYSCDLSKTSVKTMATELSKSATMEKEAVQEQELD